MTGGNGSINRQRIRKNRTRRRILTTVAAIFVIVLLWFWASPYLGSKYWTVAVFGVDSRDGNTDKGALSDVIMVASVNRRNGEVRLLSIYRDTYTQIDSEGNYHKLNEAYFLGGHQQAVKALERNFDLKIDDYVTFNWAAVAKAITALGGVDLDISDSEFHYINAFITETVNSTGLGSVQLKSAGPNHLDGVQAVAYGRLRLMDTDFNRTERQRKVLGLAMDKAKKADPVTLANIAREVFPELSTSLGISDVLELVRSVKRYKITESEGFPFSRTTMNIGKMNCVIPTTLESNVVELQNYLYAKEDYKVSSTVASISAHIGEVSGITTPGKDAPKAVVGGKSSSGSAGKNKKKDSVTVTAAAPASTAGETEKEETTAEETSETEAAETASTDEVITAENGPGSETEGKNQNDENSGPGSSTSQDKEKMSGDLHPDNADDTGDEDASNGPGVKQSD